MVDLAYLRYCAKHNAVIAHAVDMSVDNVLVRG